MIAELGLDHPDVKLSKMFGEPGRPSAEWFSDHWYVAKAPDRDEFAWSHPSSWWITDNEDGTYSVVLREYNRQDQEYELHPLFTSGDVQAVMQHALRLKIWAKIPDTQANESRSYGNAAAMDTIDLFITQTIDENKLSYKERKNLPASAFVFPKERKYPIEDKAHARNALARVSQHGSPAEQKKVRAAVHRRFPDIGDDDKKKVKESLVDLEAMHMAMGEMDRRALERVLEAAVPGAETIREAQQHLKPEQRALIAERFCKRLALRDLAPFLPQDRTLTEVGTGDRKLLTDVPTA